MGNQGNFDDEIKLLLREIRDQGKDKQEKTTEPKPDTDKPPGVPVALVPRRIEGRT